MADQQTNQYVDFPVWNQIIPKEGPRTVPFTFDFTAQSSYAVDLQNQQSRGFIQSVQSVYCRNPGTVAVTITFGAGANQQIDFPPQSAGYLPVLVQNPIKFVAASIGGSSGVQILLCNVPMPASIWPLVPYIVPQSAGAITVSDPILEAGISGALFQSQQWGLTTADTVQPEFVGGNAFALTINDAVAHTIVTPAAGTFFFVQEIEVAISTNAIAAAAGTIAFSIKEGGTTIVSLQCAIPAAAAANAIGNLVLFRRVRPYISKTAAAALTFQAFTALTGGFFTVNCLYGTTVHGGI